MALKVGRVPIAAIVLSNNELASIDRKRLKYIGKQEFYVCEKKRKVAIVSAS